ncbi:hypothetical protein EVJ58_g10391, partial [Rhodofomes roseus]
MSPDQHPCCIGLHRDRYVWGSACPESSSDALYDVRKVDAEFYVSCRHLHGVVLGSAFDIISEHSPDIRYGEVVVVDFRADREDEFCVCKARLHDFAIPPSGTIARLQAEQQYKPKVFTADQMAPRFLTGLPLFSNTIIAQGTLAASDISVALTRFSRVNITRHDPFFLRYGNTVVTVEWTDPESMASVLGDIARFTYYLYLVPHLAPDWNVEVKLQRHCYAPETMGPSVWKVSEPKNYFTGPWEIVQAGVPSVTLAVTEARFEYGPDLYAVEIENRSAVDLYLWAYVFDPEEYSIKKCYEGPESENDDPPFPGLQSYDGARRQFRRQGVHNPALEPIMLGIHGRNRQQTYFLKIFAATCPADMKGIKQESIQS